MVLFNFIGHIWVKFALLFKIWFILTFDDYFDCVPDGISNKSPKGNMWSAIPVALLCMVVNWNGGSSAAAPKGTKSYRTP